MDSERYIDLWLTVPESEAETAGELLFDLGSPGAVESPAGEGRVRVLGSFPAARLDEARAALQARAAEAAGSGLLGSVPEIGWASTPEVDWQAVMRAHHRPLDVAGVLVRPPWEATTGAPEIVLEPGMAFGTGSHETTRLCLQALAEVLAERSARRLLDVGTGSGILALVALRLSDGLEAVGCDTDPDAIEYALNAAQANGLEGRLELRLGRLDPAWGPFDLVVANLQWNVFPDELAGLAAVLAPGGRLLCSGLLLTQEAPFVRLAAEHGLEAYAQSASGEWCLVRLRRRGDG
jgi:ribosomal protein L11 methyltransferase